MNLWMGNFDVQSAWLLAMRLCEIAAEISTENCKKAIFARSISEESLLFSTYGVHEVQVDT